MSPYFQNCFCFRMCRYRDHVCKILTVRDPLKVKNLKIFPNVVFDSLSWAFWATERDAKNHSPLQSTVLEKIKKNCQKLAIVNKKKLILTIFRQFFQKTVLCRGLQFFTLRSVQCPKTLNLSYQKQPFQFFSNFSL